MIAAWFRRRQEQFADVLALATCSPDDCPDCFGEGAATIALPDGGDTVELCARCDGSGKRDQL